MKTSIFLNIALTGLLLAACTKGGERQYSFFSKDPYPDKENLKVAERSQITQMDKGDFDKNLDDVPPVRAGSHTQLAQNYNADELHAIEPASGQDRSNAGPAGYTARRYNDGAATEPVIKTRDFSWSNLMNRLFEQEETDKEAARGQYNNPYNSAEILEISGRCHHGPSSDFMGLSWGDQNENRIGLDTRRFAFDQDGGGLEEFGLSYKLSFNPPRSRTSRCR